MLFWGPPPLCHHKTQICQTVKIAYSTHVESEAEKVFRSVLEKVVVAIFGKAVFWCLLYMWSSINHTHYMLGGYGKSGKKRKKLFE